MRSTPASSIRSPLVEKMSRRDADAPGGTNSEGANGDLMAGGQDQVQCIAAGKLHQDVERERLLVGALIHCGPSTRELVFGMLAADDLDNPLAADAFEILRSLHRDGVTDIGDLSERFRLTVNARRRASRQMGDTVPFSYGGAPASWLADCYTAAAVLGDQRSAILLALPMVGAGQRRALADAAEQLAQAARTEADDDDLAALVGRLVPLLEPYRAVAS